MPLLRLRYGRTEFSKYFGAILMASLLADPSSATPERVGPAPVHTEVVAEGLVFPWSIAFLPSGEILVTERPGRLRTIRQGRLSPDSILGLPHVVNLFDVAVHPKFEQTRLVYLSYAASNKEGVGLEVMRARLRAGQLTRREVIFRARPKIPKMVMSGGRMLFGPDGSLFVTVGDRSDAASSAQDPQSDLGTVVRIADDGSIPADNPFRGGSEHRAYVFSFGHRNVQGIAYDRSTGAILLAEHGPVGGDELNVLQAGGNYGWPYVTAGTIPQKTLETPVPTATYISPVKTWQVSIAPAGLAVYSGGRFPEWRGSLFLASLTQRHVLRLSRDDSGFSSEERLLIERGARIRDVRMGPDEALYVATDELNGKILRLTPRR